MYVTSFDKILLQLSSFLLPHALSLDFGGQREWCVRFCLLFKNKKKSKTTLCLNTLPLFSYHYNFPISVAMSIRSVTSAFLVLWKPFQNPLTGESLLFDDLLQLHKRNIFFL